MTDSPKTLTDEQLKSEIIRMTAQVTGDPHSVSKHGHLQALLGVHEARAKKFKNPRPTVVRPGSAAAIVARQDAGPSTTPALDAEERRQDDRLIERARAKFQTLGVARVATDPIGTGLRFIEARSKAGTLSDHAAENLDSLLRSDESSKATARRIDVYGDPAYESAYPKLMSSTTPHLTDAERYAVGRAAEYEQRALNLSTGYGMPVIADPQIAPTAGDPASIAAVSRNVVVESNVYKAVSSDGATMTIPGEGVVSGETDSVLAGTSITVFASEFYQATSIEMWSDYPNVLEEYTALALRSYRDLLAQKCAVGVGGTTEQVGVFTDMAARTNNPARVTVTTKGVLGVVDVRALWKALPSRFRPSSTFYMAEDTLNQLRTLNANDASQLDLRYSDRLGAATLFGRPIVESDWCPAFTNTSGSENAIVVGDFGVGYTIANRGITTELIQTVPDHTTGLPTGQRGLLMIARWGSDVTAGGALRILGN
jgi:HK97 family phage major capsid protein